MAPPDFAAENFNTFTAFVTQLATDLAVPATVEIVAAAGQYDSTNNVFTMQRLAVLLSN
jgi:hypothetical protein